MAQTSAEKLEHTGPAENERVASVPPRKQLANTPDPPLLKGKRNRAVSPEHQITRWERVKVSESRTLAKERGSQQKHGEERVDSTVNEGRFREEKGGQARKAFLGEAEESLSG